MPLTTTDDPPVFRPAVPADVPAIVALLEGAYRGESSRAGWTTEADLLGGQRTDADEVGGLLASPTQRFLLAERSGTLIGSVLLTRESAQAYLGMFAVRPTLQGAGIGGRLLLEAERIAREEWHAARARMTVIGQRDDLIAWYERRGYARTGARNPFPYDNLRFGIPKRDDLYFVVLEKTLR